MPRQFGNPITRGIYDVLIKKDSAGGLGTTGQRVLTNSSWQQGLELCPQLWTIMTISLQSEVQSLVILLRLKLPVGNV